jgi:hypothetical protein
VALCRVFYATRHERIGWNIRNVAYNA